MADRNDQDQAHGEAGLERGGDKVEGHDGRVPAGNDAHGKIEADDAVDGNDQRRRQTRHDQIGHLVAGPLPA